MATATPPIDPMQDALRRLGGNWGWIFFFGAVTLIAGIVALVWPGRTILVIAVLFGFHMIFTGVFRLVSAFTLPFETGARWIVAIAGILGIIVGLVLLQDVIQSVAVLTIFLGFYWIFDGLIRSVVAIAHSEMENRGLTIVVGVISALAGMSVLAYPGSSLFFLTFVMGMWLIFFGIFELIAALRVRKFARA